MGQTEHCLNGQTDEKTSVQDRQERAGSWGGYDYHPRANKGDFAHPGAC